MKKRDVYLDEFADRQHLDRHRDGEIVPAEDVLYIPWKKYQ